MADSDSFCQKPATGYDNLRIRLENHIKFYTPKIWDAAIHTLAYVPTIFENEAKTFMALHKRGQLESGLKKLGNCKKSHFKQFGRWYVQEAIDKIHQSSLLQNSKSAQIFILQRFNLMFCLHKHYQGYYTQTQHHHTRKA